MLAILLLAPPALAAFDIGTLMQVLREHRGGRARFVEKKYVAILDRPLVSTGELRYLPPDRLEKRTLTPRPELMLLEGDTLSIERGKQKMSVRVADYPEAVAFADSIRGALAGDRAALERHYALHLSGSPEKWSLALLPGDARIAALVSRITIGGTHGRVRSVEYLQTDGDRAIMSIEPVEAP
jgi:hypothetical protein